MVTHLLGIFRRLLVLLQTLRLGLDRDLSTQSVQCTLAFILVHDARQWHVHLTCATVQQVLCKLQAGQVGLLHLSGCVTLSA